MGEKLQYPNMKQEKFIDTSDDSHVIKMVLLWDGMNIETKKHLYIFQKKIEEDTTILFENHEGENLYLLDTLLVKTCGMEIDYVW